MADRGTSAVAVGATGVGLLFLVSGLKGASVLTTLKEIIQGRKPTLSTDYPATAGTGAPPAGVNDSPGTGKTGSAAANQAIARNLAAGYGWSAGAEWDALVKLWDHESSWSNTAQNPSSGAYGIPQALPYTKMPKQAWPPANGGSASASAQISWGLSYIKGRYGSPTRALAFWTAHNWY